MSKLYRVNDTNGYTVRAKDGMEIALFHAKLCSINIKHIGNRIIRYYDIEFYCLEKVAHSTIEHEKLSTFDYSFLHPKLILNPAVTKAGKDMACSILEQAEECKVNEYWEPDHLGWNCTDSSHYYCAGDTIIGCGNTSKISLPTQLSKMYHLKIDKNMSESDAIDKILNLIQIRTAITSVFFTVGMVGVLRQIIIEAGVPIKTVVYVKGATQTQKTTTVKLTTSLYERDNLANESGICSIRVSSSKPYIESMMETLKDATLLIDDLYSTTDTKERKEQERLVYRVIRDIGDNAPRATLRGSSPINCQVILTSEYLIPGENTDIGRMFIIDVEKPLANPRLTECQETPLALSTFYYYFIAWICKSYEQIVENMRASFDSFRVTEYQMNSKYKRLYEFAFVIHFVFDIFSKYVEETISYDMKKNRMFFSENLKLLINKQISYMTSLEEQKNACSNLSVAVLSLLNKNLITLGKEGEKCYQRKNCIYISAEYLANILSDNYNHIFTSHSVTAYFRSKNFSGFYDNGTAKKKGGKRYLTLKFTELEADAQKLK